MWCHPPHAVLNVMFLSIEEAKTNILSKADILVSVWSLVAFPVAGAPLSKPGGEMVASIALTLGCFRGGWGKSGGKELKERYLV
jgi:hypothetical protein